jgi:hypothetical protein
VVELDLTRSIRDGRTGFRAWEGGRADPRDRRAAL